MPGLEMPISMVTEVLSKMWQVDGVEANRHAFARSSQLNIILHNGLYASHGKALQAFNDAIGFAKKYPCRIVVLCPEKARGDGVHLTGKLFSQCYIGEDVREQCCCEALILGYTTDDAVFLKDQVSLWLESDLPTYYWVNEISPGAIKKHYLSLAALCNAVIYDSAVEPEGFKEIHWSGHEWVSDLAYMRLLPVRQSLGQFLSAYKEEVLVEGLKKVVVEYSGNYCGEGEALLNWFSVAIEKCAKLAEVEGEVLFELKESKGEGFDLRSKWTYGGDKFFEWQYRYESRISEVKAKLSQELVNYPSQLRKMSPEEALAAAIFY
ncbi:hypothetical protein AYO37_00195 [Opitutia bacterium SCGC AG-212-L18]|nr:hypothetical protein AYO37_00195 [Opitutae bacterium SCGC AG-212-L18]